VTKWQGDARIAGPALPEALEERLDVSAVPPGSKEKMT
jgi:hypothetical protein